MNDPAGTTAATAGVESWDTPGTVTNGETTEWVDAHVVVIADCDTGETTIPPMVEETLASTGNHGVALGGGITPNPFPTTDPLHCQHQVLTHRNLVRHQTLAFNVM